MDNALNFLDRASAANSELTLLDDVRDSIRQATTLQVAIAEMLQNAGGLRAAGTLINPPGENAAEIYHRVLAADPDNSEAENTLERSIRVGRGLAYIYWVGIASVGFLGAVKPF